MILEVAAVEMSSSPWATDVLGLGLGVQGNDSKTDKRTVDLLFSSLKEAQAIQRHAGPSIDPIAVPSAAIASDLDVSKTRA